LGRPFAIGSHFSHFGLKEKKSFLSAIIEWKEGKEEEKEKEKKRKKRKEKEFRFKSLVNQVMELTLCFSD